MNRKTTDKSTARKQLNARNRRLKFWLLMTISGIGAQLTLYFQDFTSSGAPEYPLAACACIFFILTFLISGIGLIMNIFQWISGENMKEKTNE